MSRKDRGLLGLNLLDRLSVAFRVAARASIEHPDRIVYLKDDEQQDTRRVAKLDGYGFGGETDADALRRLVYSMEANDEDGDVLSPTPENYPEGWRPDDD
jgi:hypothetical protein